MDTCHYEIDETGFDVITCVVAKMLCKFLHSRSQMQEIGEAINLKYYLGEMS